MNITIKTILTTILITFSLWLGFKPSAFADVIALQSGGRIEGTVLNSAGSKPENYRIKTVQGIVLDLPSSEVEYISSGPQSEEYEQKSKNMPDTVVNHLEMAQWCEDNNMKSLADRHYRRVVELDIDNTVARRKLGYIKRNGAWTTKQQAMEDQGRVEYKGEWITPQEKELKEKSKKSFVNNAQWTKKINQWRNNLGGRKNQEAIDGLRSIQDPAAIPALAAVLKTDIKNDWARLLYIEILGSLGTPSAMEVLGQTAMNDPVEEVRLSCVDELKKHQAQAAVDYFVKELSSKDNNRVNRAGELIAEFGNMNSVPSLIQALSTKHKYVKKAGPGMSVANGNDGTSGMAMGGKDQIFNVMRPNPKVLDALVRITGQNFQYDKNAWHEWYSKTSQKASNVDLRRQ